MANQQDLLRMRGQRMIDLDGDRVGKIDEIYLNRDTDQPEWALVHTGLFGTRSTFVPLVGAQVSGDAVTVRYDKSQIREAPKMEPSGELSEDEEAALYRYYGLEYAESDQTEVGAGRAGDRSAGMDRNADFDHDPSPTTGRGPVGEDVSGPTTDDAMTRSEEELRITKERRRIGTARLRKYIETERVHETIPVEREEIRIEREPFSAADIGDAAGGLQLSEEEHEVTLMGEEVDVDKRVVPKERIRLDKETVRDEVEVDEEVRKERVDVDTDIGTDRPTDGPARNA